MQTFTCDKCKKQLKDIMEIQEMLHIRFVGGYLSTFGDGTHINLDICQQCLYNFVKDFLPVTTEEQPNW